MHVPPTFFSVPHTSCVEIIDRVAVAEYISRSADRSTSDRAAAVSDLRAQVLAYPMFAHFSLGTSDCLYMSTTDVTSWTRISNGYQEMHLLLGVD